MKRIGIILLLLVMLAAMTGCKNDKDSSSGNSAAETVSYALSGTFRIVSYTEGGQIYDIKSRGLTDVSISFNPDGTGVINGTDGKAAFTYSEDTITTNANETFRLSRQDGRIIVIQTVNGIDHTMIFQ